MKSLFRQTVLFILLSSAITASAQIRPVTRPVRTQQNQQPTQPTRPTNTQQQNKPTTSRQPARTPTNPPAKQNAQSSPASRDKILANLAADMVYVEGGTFTMGATAEQGSDAEDDEKPAHQVTLSSFYICKHEVTQEEWEAVMGSNPSEFKGKRRPVENVSWEDCQTFISKLNSITGKHYRLPTEAEWEYAARGGSRSQGYKYSGSNNLGNVAWDSYYGDFKTHEVMTKSPNELGLYDMSGNVWEWCSDWYDSKYYASSPNINPKGASSGPYHRVKRGGSWFYGLRSCCVSNRRYSVSSFCSNDLGLRLVL